MTQFYLHFLNGNKNILVALFPCMFYSFESHFCQVEVIFDSCSHSIFIKLPLSVFRCCWGAGVGTKSAQSAFSAIDSLID